MAVSAMLAILGMEFFMMPPKVESWYASFGSLRKLLLLFHLRDSQLTIWLLSNKVNLVADLYLVKHCRVLDAENHGHGVHAEILERTVLDGHFASTLIDLFHLSCGH